MKHNVEQKLKDFASAEEKRVIKSIDDKVAEDYAEVIFSSRVSLPINNLDKMIITTIRFICKTWLETENKYVDSIDSELITSSLNRKIVGKKLLFKLKNCIGTTYYDYFENAFDSYFLNHSLAYAICEMLYDDNHHYVHHDFRHDVKGIINIFRRCVCWLFWKAHMTEELKNYLPSVIAGLCIDYVNKMSLASFEEENAKSPKFMIKEIKRKE